jgi:hypothetical protein
VRLGHQRALWQDIGSVDDLKAQLANGEVWNWLLTEVPALKSAGAKVSGLMIPGEGARLLVTIAAALRTEKPFVFVDEFALRALPGSKWRRSITDLFRRRAVFLVYDRTFRSMGHYGEDAVVVMTRTGIVGLMKPDEAVKLRPKIEQIVNEERRDILIEDAEEFDQTAA